METSHSLDWTALLVPDSAYCMIFSSFFSDVSCTLAVYLVTCTLFPMNESLIIYLLLPIPVPRMAHRHVQKHFLPRASLEYVFPGRFAGWEYDCFPYLDIS